MDPLQVFSRWDRFAARSVTLPEGVTNQMNRVLNFSGFTAIVLAFRGFEGTDQRCAIQRGEERFKLFDLVSI